MAGLLDWAALPLEDGGEGFGVCPRCGASGLDDCHAASGKPSPIHAARVAAQRYRAKKEKQALAAERLSNILASREKAVRDTEAELALTAREKVEVYERWRDATIALGEREADRERRHALAMRLLASIRAEIAAAGGAPPPADLDEAE